MMAIIGIDTTLFVPQLFENFVVISEFEAMLYCRPISKRQLPSFKLGLLGF